MSLKIIVAKTGWCGHCNSFMPVLKNLNNSHFDKIKQKYNLNNVSLEVFDMENSTDKNNYNNKYLSKGLDVAGYPSVYGLVNNNNNEFSFPIDHVEVHNNNLNASTDEFVNNIISSFNTKKSLKGGSLCPADDMNIEINENNQNINDINDINEYYRLKYIKYKNKYLTLKMTETK